MRCIHREGGSYTEHERVVRACASDSKLSSLPENLVLSLSLACAGLMSLNNEQLPHSTSIVGIFFIAVYVV